MQRPLQGVRVLELATGIAGPYCGKLFGDFGADVLKVEPLDGDESRRWGPFLDGKPGVETSALFLHLNTNKRSLTLDLAAVSGRDLARRLVAEHDIVIESFGPHGLAKRGLGVEQLHEINPSLIVTSVTPFGADGPFAGYRGSEIVYSAIGGMNFTRAADNTPLALGGNLTQYHAGSLSATATLAALMMVEDGAPGVHVDMSIAGAEAGSADMTMTYLTSHSYTGRVSTPPDSAAAASTGLGPLPNGVFMCADGPVVVSTMPQWVPRMLALIGDDRLTALFADRERLALPETAAEIRDRVAQWFADRPRYRAMTDAQAAGWAVTAIMTPRELIDDPHVVSRGLVFEVDHPVVGRVAHLGPPIRMDDGWRLDSLAPSLGQHNDEVLGSLGLSTDDQVAYRASKVV